MVFSLVYTTLTISLVGRYQIQGERTGRTPSPCDLGRVPSFLSASIPHLPISPHSPSSPKAAMPPLSGPPRTLFFGARPLPFLSLVPPASSPHKSSCRSHCRLQLSHPLVHTCTRELHAEWLTPNFGIAAWPCSLQGPRLHRRRCSLWLHLRLTLWRRLSPVPSLPIAA